MSVIERRWSEAGQRTADAPSRPAVLGQPVRIAEPGVNPELDQETQRGLRAAARDLANEFAGTCDSETIERFLMSRYAHLVATARITKFLPLLAERYVRERLRVLET